MANTPLNTFISKVKTGGLSRTNRYIVGIFHKDTSKLNNFNNTLLSDALLLCDQVQLPGTNFNTNEVHTYGEVTKAPYERLYEDINMSFYVDTSMNVKLLFDNWMTYIQNPGTRNFNYYDSYTADIVIEVQDINNKSRYGIKLFEAYPKSIGAIQMDYSGKDFMKISINFAYKYYRVGALETVNAADGGFSPYNYMGTSPENYQPILNPIQSAAQTQNDPLNNFVNRLQNFAIGAVGAKVVSAIPGILKNN